MKFLKSGPVVMFIVTSGLLLLTEVACRTTLWLRTPEAMVFDPEIIYRLQPNSTAHGITYNSEGCIGDDFNTDDPSKIEVLLLGGSTSFSISYVTQLKDQLVAKLAVPSDSIKVMSCGRPRYTSYVNKVILERFLSRFKPEVVALYLGINDNIYNTFQWLDKVPSVGFFDFKSTNNLVAWEMFKYYVLQKNLLSRPHFVNTELPSAKIFSGNLDEILLMTKSHGVRLATTTFGIALPTDDAALRSKIYDEEPLMRHFWGDVESTVFGVRKHNEILQHWASRNGVPCSLFSETVERSSSSFLDICHMTDFGYRQLANSLSDAIVQSLSE